MGGSPFPFTVCFTKEGTACALLQFGFMPEWWGDAMAFFCFAHNIEDRLADGKTAYERRFDQTSPYKIFTFGAEVDYKQNSPAVLNQMHPFRPKMLK